MFCSQCGNKIEENEKFCGNCGMSVEMEEKRVQGEQTAFLIGYQEHSSGFFYKQEYVQNQDTGKMMERVTWFNPFTGEYKEVMEDESGQRQSKKAGVLYGIMVACGVLIGLVFIYFMPKQADTFSMNISEEQLMKEQDAGTNLVNALREYTKGHAEPMEGREE